MNNYIMALFASGTTNFDYAGMGALKDAITAVATETATSNGNITYTMEMTYPVNGYLADQLVEGNLIKAQVSKTPGDYMIFEINETLKSDDTTITVYCDAYANRILRMSFDNGGKFGSFGNVQQALNAARAQMTGIQSDFTLSSGIGTSLNMSGVTSKNTLPTTYQDFNAYLDAIMDKVQGNVRFGVNSIQIVSDRGRDITSTVLRDDKNTNGISIKVDTSNIVNRIIPMLPVLDKDGNVTQETKVGKIVTSSVAFKFINFYAGQVVSVDTQDLANSYFNRTNCDRPTTTATVQTSMLDEDLTDIRLFDRVQVYSSKIGYQAKLKVCERDFDILAGAVSTFKLGSSSVTIFNSQTSVVNALNSAIQSSQYAAITADGKNTAYYEGANPDNPKENDLWFHTVNGVSQIDQYINGNWVTIVSDSTGTEINKKVDQMGLEAKSAVDQAKAASDKVDQIASKFDDTNKKVDQALENSVSAQSDAASAAAKAESTASGFGKLDQKADSALSAALSAQTNANTAVSQASSAAADSKDAKQIAGAVSQSYQTLTDGSTMTIAELENGLATKLTKTDLDGYATQTWTQNQIKVTADGINATMSSIKSTVDGQTTSINDLQADSSSFKSQFTTVNNTLGKQTTDISTLQATSKELTSGFNTLTTDNATNKNDISQLRQTATELNSTMMTVQTQVQNSAVGTNLLLDSQTQTRKPSWYTQNNNWTEDRGTYLGSNIEYVGGPWGNARYSYKDLVDRDVINTTDYFTYSIYFRVVGEDPAGMSYAYIDFLSAATTKNGTVPLKLTTLKEGQWARIVVPFKFTEFEYDPTKDYNYSIRIEMSAAPKVDGARYEFAAPKLEKGSVATDYSVSPEDTATVTAFSKLSQTVDGMQLDISKKIEQKDLNGYATQTWTQNQIKLTSDSLSATLSSVKSTVDGHTTSINSLQADSSGFKAQFTTVNNTLGKQTTDISTLQSTTKSLSASFDSLNADNATNKHNISQLQLTANSFSTTLATVQQQVTDSSVGINMLRNARSLDGWKVWGGAAQGKGFNIEDTLVDSGLYRMAHIFNNVDGQNSDGIFWPGTNLFLTAGQVYTISIWAHSLGTSDQPVSWTLWLNWDKDHTYQGVSITKTTSPDWKLYSATFKATVGGQVNNVRIVPFFGTGAAANVGGSVYLLKPKLEKGSVATDFSVNPADNATVDSVSSISQTVDAIQTTVRGKVDNDVYQSKMTQLDSQITTVVGQVNSLGQKNLIVNSQFQYDWQKSWWIASSVRENWYTSNYTWSWLDGYQGICANIPQNQSESWPHVQSSDVAIPDPGTTAYSASVYVNIDWVETYCVLDMSFYDAAGNRTFHDTTAANKGMNFLKLENIVSPKDAVRVHIELHIHDHGHAAFIEPMFVQDSTVGKYIPDNATWTEVQQTYDSINLKVSKDGVVNAVNISPEGIQIYGNKLHITAATYIDNAVIKDAMIANLSASKLTAGSINAANINVYNLNGANIVANSITAEKLQAGAMLIAMNSTLQTLKLGTDGMLTTNTDGTVIGKIHTNVLVNQPGSYGLSFDLGSGGNYMAWGAQNEGDPGGTYPNKLLWARNSKANQFGLPYGGFIFYDKVIFNKTIRLAGDSGIDIQNAYQLLKFGTVGYNNTVYPFFGSSNFKAGWMFGSSETYLVRDGGIIQASKILGTLNGQSYKFPLALNSNGTIKTYTDVHF